MSTNVYWSLLRVSVCLSIAVLFHWSVVLCNLVLCSSALTCLTDQFCAVRVFVKSFMHFVEHSYVYCVTLILGNYTWICRTVYQLFSSHHLDIFWHFCFFSCFVVFTYSNWVNFARVQFLVSDIICDCVLLNFISTPHVSTNTNTKKLGCHFCGQFLMMSLIVKIVKKFVLRNSCYSCSWTTSCLFAHEKVAGKSGWVVVYYAFHSCYEIYACKMLWRHVSN